MGMDISAVRFLLAARSMGVDFTETAMIGRQALYMTHRELRTELGRAGFGFDAADIDSIFHSTNGYAEQLLRFLGATEVHSIDVSPYEGATHIHDMNQPIPDHFKQLYDVVFDGGSLEHVFDFPTSIKNCLEMVKLGGHFISIAPSNNFLGHGFYQFSPAVYFHVLCEANGYYLREIILSEERESPLWFRIGSYRDKDLRIEHINDCPTYLLVLAQRSRLCPLLERPPTQGDYVISWSNASRQVDGQRQLWIANTALKTWLRTHIPHRLRRFLMRQRMTFYRLQHFRAVRDRTYQS